MKTIKLSLFIALSLLFASNLSAQKITRKQVTENSIPKFVEYLTKTLSLDQSQADKATQTLKTNFASLDGKLKGKPKSEKKEIKKETWKKIFTEINSTLSESQKVTLKQQRKENKKEWRKIRHLERISLQVDRMDKNLDLTDEQEEKVTNILIEKHKKIKTERKNYKGDQEKWKARKKEIRKETKQNIKAVLTQEQIEKMKNNKKKIDETLNSDDDEEDSEE